MADAWHGHGIATVLLAHLAHTASTAGVDTFTASVLSGNHRMLGVFHESAFLISARRSEDAIEIEFPTAGSELILGAVSDPGSVRSSPAAPAGSRLSLSATSR